jgi:hypothetical protein
MQPKPMQLAVAKWVLGLLPSESLPEIAATVLENGLDTPALRQLAGELRPTMRDAGPIFQKAVVELGITLPSKPDAGLIVAREYATEISEGITTPYEGARRIWREIQLEVEELKHQFDPFVYWASEREDADDPARREFCENAIRAAARNLLDGAS